MPSSSGITTSKLNCQLACASDMADDATQKTSTKKVTRKPRYTLAELLEGQEEMAALSKEAAAWMDAAPVGNEVQ